MAKYKYNALKSNNNIINGEIEASNPREAREKIRELGFLPTKIYLEQSQESQQYSDLINVTSYYHTQKPKNLKRLKMEFYQE